MSHQLDLFVSRISSTTGASPDKSGNGFRVVCPLHGGKDKNLALTDGDIRVVAKCHSHDCDPKDIAESVGLSVNDYYFEQSNSNVIPLKRSEPKINEYAVKLLNDAKALVQSQHYYDKWQVIEYLNNRGMSPLLPEDIGFDEHSYYSKGVYYPAMIALIRNVNGEIVGGHRTFIPGGYKLKNGTAKKLFPNTKEGVLDGAAVRLSNHESDEIYLVEGTETGFSVIQLLSNKNPIVWACLSTSGMKNIQLPDKYKTIYLMIDKDVSGAGLKAGIAAKQRLEKEGRTVQIIEPPLDIPNGQNSVDWNDVLEEQICQ